MVPASSSRSTSIDDGVLRRCLACNKLSCPLLTHRRHSAALTHKRQVQRKTADHVNQREYIRGGRLLSDGAYDVELEYVDRDIAPATLDPFYKLPIPAHLQDIACDAIFRFCG